MIASLPLFVGLRYSSAKRGGMLVAFLSRISVAGLVLGVTLLITVLSVMNGFEKELQNRILSLVPHAMITNGYPIDEWKTLSAVIEQNHDVINTAPFISINALLSAGKNVEVVQVHSVNPVLELSLTGIDKFVTAGEFLSLRDVPNSIVLGKFVARNLQLEIGDKLRMVVPDPRSVSSAPKFATYTVGAIFHSGTGIDQELAIISLGAGQKMLGMGDAVQGVRVQTSNIFETRRISGELIDQLPPGYYARDWRQLYGNLFEAIQMSRRLVTLMIFMVITVALFNVVSSLVMVVTDKRADIAILKTMGAGTRDVLRIFLVHGVVIALIGTGLGVVLGCALSLWLPELVSTIEGWFGFQFLQTSVYPVDYIPSDLRMSDVAVIAGSAIVMSIIATVYPALRASRVEPAKALRR